MQEVRVTPVVATIAVTRDDVRLLLSALNETLECLDDFEFSTRTGFERDDFRLIQAELLRVMTELQSGPSDSPRESSLT
jgi:hypothetical protein